MEDLLSRLEELLQTDPNAAADFADELLADIDEEMRLVARVLCAWGGVRRTQGDWAAAESAYERAELLLKTSQASLEDWRDWHSRMALASTGPGRGGWKIRTVLPGPGKWT